MSHNNVVDSVEWLLAKADALMARRDPSAEGYWTRLLSEPALDEVTRTHVHTQLAVSLFRRGAIDDAEAEFGMALKLGASPAFISYARGHCALAKKASVSVLQFLRAFAECLDPADEAEYLRSLSVSLRELGLHEAALVVLTGALERAPNHPSVLEALGIQYERMERWVEAIQARDTLIELLKSNLPVQFRNEPALDTTSIAPSKAEEDVRAINDRLRRAFMIVMPDDEFLESDQAMSRTNLPAGLHTLVSHLAARKDPEPLLQVAARFWALARHDGLDEHLSPYVIAATIQWLTERATWRVRTSDAGLKAAYGVDADQIRASARLLLSRFDTPILPTRKLVGMLSAAEGREVEKLIQAVLLGIPLKELDGARTLL